MDSYINYLKERVKARHGDVHCAACDEIVMAATVLRHDVSGAPVEQTIFPRYCPVCGNILYPFSS